MQKETERFIEYIKAKGLRITEARQIIAEEVFNIHSHFSADELYLKMKRKQKSVSRASVYRTLEHLVDSDLVSKLVISGDRSLYEHVYGHTHHDHLVCLICGKIIEFENREIENLQNEICKKLDFKPVTHSLKINGHCSECFKKEGK